MPKKNFTLISDEEISRINPNHCVCGITDARAMCQAQLDSCEKQLKELDAFKVGKAAGAKRAGGGKEALRRRALHELF